MSKLHELKTDPEPFSAVWTSRKTVEIRRDDRAYQATDVLHLREHERREGYTGREILALVVHLQDGYGLVEDHVAMSIKILARLNDKESGACGQPQTLTAVSKTAGGEGDG